MGAEPKVELLWWPGCPSHDSALADLRAALGELRSNADVEVVRIETEQDADREGFPGSPTIRVDGHDLLPTGERRAVRPDVPALPTARRPRSPTPDPADLREALAAAIDTRKEVTDA